MLVSKRKKYHHYGKKEILVSSAERINSKTFDTINKSFTFIRKRGGGGGSQDRTLRNPISHLIRT